MNVNEFRSGAVLNTSFSIWIKNLLPFSIIAAIFYLPAFLYGWWYFEGLFEFTQKELIVHGALMGLTFFALGYAVSGALVYGVFQQIRGRHAGVGECIANGLKRLPPVMGVVLLTVLIIGGLGGVLILPALAVPALALVLVPIAAVVVIVVAIMLYVAVPAAVVERPGVMGALRRSKDLTAGMKGRIFGVLFVLWVIGFITDKVFNAAIGDPTDLSSVKTVFIVGLVVDLLLGVLGAVTNAVVYHDLRQAKEGVGIEELAQVFD